MAVFSGQNITTPDRNLSKNPSQALPRQHCPNRRAPQTHASPNKAYTASPQRSVAMNRRTNSPSPMWVANQHGQGFSPADKANPNRSPHRSVRNQTLSATFSSTPPLTTQSTKSEANREKARPAPVQTACGSPNASDYEDAEDDGITLSPTFSEVSGLTLPTCLDGEDGSKTTLQSDVFDNLSKASAHFDKTISPIARHRQRKQEDILGLSSTSTAGTTIAKHPYLQRMNKKPTQASSGKLPRNKNVNPADRIHEMPTPRAKGGLNQANKIFSRREQIVRRVRASPRHKTIQSVTTKSFSQEWQEQNVIAEHEISQASSGKLFDNFDVSSTKPKGRVAQRVTQVNKKVKNDQKQCHNNMKRTSRQSDDQRQRFHPQNGNHGDSDCIRTIRID